MGEIAKAVIELVRFRSAALSMSGCPSDQAAPGPGSPTRLRSDAKTPNYAKKQHGLAIPKSARKPRFFSYIQHPICSVRPDREIRVRHGTQIRLHRHWSQD